MHLRLCLTSLKCVPCVVPCALPVRDFCTMCILKHAFDQLLFSFLFSVSRVDFPHLASQGSWGTKNTPVKGSPGGSLSRQKSMGGRATEHSLSSSPASAQSSLKGKRDAMSKHSGKS